uniref:Uncharacterized protein n=1 Tax=Anguilla anguilla TaxID=7936 RepID=A0A0E9SIS4_ANGAN
MKLFSVGESVYEGSSNNDRNFILRL